MPTGLAICGTEVFRLVDKKFHGQVDCTCLPEKPQTGG